jgi:hypothetical protein
MIKHLRISFDNWSKNRFVKLEKTYQLIKIIKLCFNIKVDENYFQSVISWTKRLKDYKYFCLKGWVLV